MKDVKRLNEIIEDLECNRHNWADDHTVYKIIEALEILRDAILTLSRRT